MKHLFLMAIIISCVATATAQTFYVNNYWTNGSKKIAYVTNVYSYTNSATAKNNGYTTSHYSAELKNAFNRYLENNGVENVADHNFNTFNHSENKEKVEMDNESFINRLKRDGYKVHILSFTWKPKD